MSLADEEFLKGARIAKPCHQSWDQMTGDAQVRHCAACKLNVYNLVGMDSGDAMKLLREREGRLCVRLYQRTDGTLMTQDCPVGLARARRRVALALTSALAFVVALLANAGFPIQALTRNRSTLATRLQLTLWEMELGSLRLEMLLAKERLRDIPPLRAVLDWIDPPPPPMVMGAMSPGTISPRRLLKVRQETIEIIRGTRRAKSDATGNSFY